MSTWMTLATAAAIFLGAELWYWIRDQRAQGRTVGDDATQTVLTIVVTDGRSNEPPPPSCPGGA